MTSQISEATQYLTPAEVAQLLRVRERTLADWRYKGEGPPFIKVGARVRYPSGRLQTWLEEHTS